MPSAKRQANKRGARRERKEFKSVRKPRSGARKPSPWLLKKFGGEAEDAK